MDADTLTTLRKQLDEARARSIGFPGAVDFDYTDLADLLATQLLNNVGDPDVDGIGTNHTKAIERDVVTWFADLFRAPAQDRWGYVTSGGTEGNLYALSLARQLYPDGIVYHSDAAHPSVDKAIDLLRLPSVRIATAQWGEINYDDLLYQVNLRRDRPAIVVATAGTTMTEAVDDVSRIRTVLDRLVIRRRFVHVDAALAGIPLALLPPAARPGLDLADGAHCVAVSGHKFVGVPTPCGVVLTRRSTQLQAEHAGGANYVGSPDRTILGSRSGHTPLILAHAIERFGIEGLRERARHSRDLAAYAAAQIIAIGRTAFRHEHAFTVVIATPSDAITSKWTLPSVNGLSHLITMPGITREQIDEFVEDLAKDGVS